MPSAGSTQKRKQFFSFNKYIWNALDWLYPPSCCSCGRSGVIFCEECQSSIMKIKGNLCISCGIHLRKKQTKCVDCLENPPIFREMRSWAVYEGSIREAIHSLKYKQNIALGHILAKQLINVINQSNWKVDLIIPIPLSDSHYKQRGYNQSALISRFISKSINIHHSNDAVVRIRDTKTQISLDIKERFTNLDGAFWGNPAKLNTRSVLIIDDVITTGATMQSCAKEVIDAGAKQVYCLSVARAVLRTSKQK